VTGVRDLDALREKVAALWPHLDERARRLFAAGEARALGHGGVSLVSRACGLSRVTITKGLRELDEAPLPAGRVRRPGAGRPRTEERDPELPERLDALVEPLSRGDPESPLRWTSKSTRALAKELTRSGHPISHETVAQLLRALDYSLQGTRKTEEGRQHPDRDAQFRFINEEVRKALAARRPVISVDTKKKELIGNYANTGRTWRPAKAPSRVQSHDFPTPAVPRAYPYGIYDLAHNTGFVNVGTDHDTGAFAVASIRGWWRTEGRRLYPRARSLLITADGGGSNGYRLRLWKLKLQEFADEADLTARVCHFPPGTSKWNKVEHRLFSFISTNWRGEPLRDYETIVQLIARTTTARGLKVTCRLDRRRFPLGRKVSDAEFATVRLFPNRFHGEWNYAIGPHRYSQTLFTDTALRGDGMKLSEVTSYIRTERRRTFDLSEGEHERFVRWIEIGRSQLTATTGIFLSLALATFSYSMYLFKDDSFNPRGVSIFCYAVGTGLLLLAILAGAISAIVRMYNFRWTAQMIRLPQDKRAELRKVLECLDVWTWRLLWIQILAFLIGFAGLVVAIM
jgi:hypothetical protein